MTLLDHLSRTVRSRSRAVSRPLVLAGIAALSLAPLAGAVPASAAAAARPAAISLFGPAAKFHAGGHSWTMSVFVFSGSVSIRLATSHEFDSWNFIFIPKSDMKVNVRTGVATFKGHNSMAPVAFANLRFSPSSRHKASCRAGSETIFDGKITGSISLAANHRLKFRSAHVTFRRSELAVNHACLPRSKPTVCISGFWGIGERIFASGNSPGLPGRHSVSIFKSARLRAPTNGTVSYDIFGTARKPVFDSKAKRLSVKATGVVKGSAVLKATAPPTVRTSRCTIGRRHFKARDARFFGSFKSPAGGQFHARSIVGGLIKVSHSGFAGFDIVTLKKA